MTQLLDFILHIDKHLLEIVTDYRTWTYLILFLIVFAETGLVIFPLLPGDSLLFAAGSLAALDGSPLDPYLLAVTFFVAAFAGDNTNYAIGHAIGPKVFTKNYRFLNMNHLNRTKNFYALHGGKTVIIARFIPIVRTFAPFVAGIGSMKYPKFILFSMAGSVAWILAFVFGGYFFGQLPIIKNNFSLVTIGIIGVSVLPILFTLIKSKLEKK